MKKKFADYLQQMRQANGLTQQQVIDHLIMADPAFDKLDITTFSRWERGATAPKLSKQLLLARIFGDDIRGLIDPSIDQQEATLEVMNDLIGPAMYPYWQGEKQSITEELLLSEANVYSLTKLKAFHEHYLGLEIAEDLIRNENVILRTINDTQGHLLGHRLYTFVPVETPDEALDITDLRFCPFTTLEKSNKTPLSMYTISGYNPLPDARLANLLNLIEVLRTHPEIKYLITNCHRQANYQLYDMNTDCEVIAKGDVTKEGGVKVFGKRYKYIRLKIKVETLLAAKVITRILPHSQNMHELTKRSDESL